MSKLEINIFLYDIDESYLLFVKKVYLINVINFLRKINNIFENYLSDPLDASMTAFPLLLPVRAFLVKPVSAPFQ